MWTTVYGCVSPIQSVSRLEAFNLACTFCNRCWEFICMYVPTRHMFISMHKVPNSLAFFPIFHLDNLISQTIIIIISTTGCVDVDEMHVWYFYPWFYFYHQAVSHTIASHGANTFQGCKKQIYVRGNVFQSSFIPSTL